MSFQTRTFKPERFDPLALFARLCPEGPGFLESPAPSPRTGRYSIVPLRRREAYRLDQRGLARLDEEGETPLPGDPFAVLEQILAERRVPPSENGFAFPGGFFGFFSYDLAGRIEELPRQARRDRPVPELWLDWVDLTAIYDHQQQTLTLATLDPEYDLAALESEVRSALALPLVSQPLPATPPPQPILSQQQFEGMVERVRAYIAAGDIYQANLSCRFDGRFAGDTCDLYARLRKVNPSPFACLLRAPGLEIISSSPERLVSLHRGI
uniref:chorismate-binding protein n=1 Tax=Trichloromonas sp. TaxID=3069249 RepID=UPI003D818DAB